MDLPPKSQVNREALLAFREDSSYVIAMLKQAVNIQNKRENYKIREELRMAESEARETCSKAEAFNCNVLSPCGVGLCKFAKEEYKPLRVQDIIYADEDKPQGGKAYSINTVVSELRERRRKAKTS